MRSKLRYAIEIVIVIVLPLFGYVIGLFQYAWEYGIEGRKPHHVRGMSGQKVKP